MTMASLRPGFFRRTALLVASLGLFSSCNRTFYREAADLTRDLPLASPVWRPHCSAQHGR